MFQPQYTITPKLLDNIKQIERLIIEFNDFKLSQTVFVKMEREARALSAFSSTSIEGNPLLLTDVKRILKSKPEYVRDSEKEVLNYNNALEHLDKYFKKHRNILLTHDLICDIQKRITSELMDKSNCGQYRKIPVFVNDPRIRQTVYWPPDAKDVMPLMEDLITFINSNQHKLDALIRAGIFHKQFVIIHPFMDGNGRTSRLSTKVLLAALGLNTFPLFSFENYYNNNVGKYFEFVGVKGNYYDIKKEIDFTPWLEYFTDGIIDEMLRVKKQIPQGTTPETKLKPYHEQIIKFIKENDYIKDSDYMKLTKRSRASRTKDFNQLMKLKIIVRKGKARASYYTFPIFSPYYPGYNFFHGGSAKGQE